MDIGRRDAGTAAIRLVSGRERHSHNSQLLRPECLLSGKATPQMTGTTHTAACVGVVSSMFVFTVVL